MSPPQWHLFGYLTAEMVSSKNKIAQTVTHWEAYNPNTKTNEIFHIHRNNKNKMSLNVPSATDGMAPMEWPLSG